MKINIKSILLLAGLPLIPFASAQAGTPGATQCTMPRQPTIDVSAGSPGRHIEVKGGDKTLRAFAARVGRAERAQMQDSSNQEVCRVLDQDPPFVEDNALTLTAIPEKSTNEFEGDVPDDTTIVCAVSCTNCEATKKPGVDPELVYTARSLDECDTTGFDKNFSDPKTEIGPCFYSNQNLVGVPEIDRDSPGVVRPVVYPRQNGELILNDGSSYSSLIADLSHPHSARSEADNQAQAAYRDNVYEAELEYRAPAGNFPFMRITVYEDMEGRTPPFGPWMNSQATTLFELSNGHYGEYNSTEGQWERLAAFQIMNGEVYGSHMWRESAGRNQFPTEGLLRLTWEANDGRLRVRAWINSEPFALIDESLPENPRLTEFTYPLVRLVPYRKWRIALNGSSRPQNGSALYQPLYIRRFMANGKLRTSETEPPTMPVMGETPELK